MHIEPARPHAIVLLWPVPRVAGGDHVESAFVEPNGCGPDATSGLWRLDLELAGPRQGVSNETPLNEILAVVDRGPGDVFEARRDEEEVIVDSDD